jgi:hypothetical protein
MVGFHVCTMAKRGLVKMGLDCQANSRHKIPLKINYTEIILNNQIQPVLRSHI